MKNIKNIGFLVSGGGTNLQAVIDAISSGAIENAKIVTVVSSKEGVFALERAKKNNIPSVVIKKCDFETQDDLDNAIIGHMQSRNVELIVMAGYMQILGKRFTDSFMHKVINVHPALIPSFCGKGYYGLLVHEKALEYGVKITGATVHFVNEIPDGGPIILQKAVDVDDTDTPKTLQKRVMENAEWKILALAVNYFCNDRLFIEGNKVYIREENV